MEDYKYLGVTINHRLDWRSNTEAVYKKGMSRLYFLRKLRSFNMCSKMLEIFYQSVASILFFASWIILSTLSTSHWSDSGAPSPKGCFSFAVITTDIGNLSYHKP